MATVFRRRLGVNETQTNAILNLLRAKPKWWDNVLNASYRGLDGKIRQLLIAVRDGYLNAYADGQSVLKISFAANGQPRCEVHRRYVFGPQAEAGADYVVYDLSQIDDPNTLRELIDTALYYAGDEKRGVATIAANHPNTIDVEMTLPANEPVEPNTKKTAPRMDLVALERADDGVRVAFYEVKQFSNPELRANLKPKVLTQLKKYEDYVSAPIRRAQVIDAYRNACVILRDIAAMRGTAIGSLVHEVANNPRLLVNLDPKPRLIVFGYSSKQARDKHWLQHEKVLHDRGYTLLMEERAEDMQLSSCRSGVTAEQDLRAKLQGLARFVSVFTEPGFHFGTWDHPPPRASGIHVLPFCLLSDEGQEFYNAVYKLGWVTQFQWSEWMHTPEGRELTEKPDRIAEATPNQLAKVITVFVRDDRFNEGLLNSKFESGLLTAIVRRAEALLQVPPHSGELSTTEQ